MSNSAVPLKTVAVYEPRMVLDNERLWVVCKGGQSVTYYPFPSTSFSTNQFNFICNPPSANTVLDRAVFIEVPFEMVLKGPGGVNNLLQPGRDALRAFPLSSVTNTLSVTLNGYNTNIELAQVIHAMSRFHAPLAIKNGWMSLQPSFEDNYAAYRDADGANNNPLGDYTDAAGMSEIGRGAYFISSTANVINTPTEATIKGVIREQVFLPPFLWSEDQAGGLSNLTSLQFNWVLNNNLQRMWSHSDVTDVAGVSTITSIEVTFDQPSMYLGFITPRLSQPIPPVITYPFSTISRYTTVTNQTIVKNTGQQLKSNIIQLNSIPRKMYIYAKRSDANIYNQQTIRNKISATDTFLQIRKVNILFNNFQGILSGASPANLYMFTRQNGYNKSWTEWYGLTQQFSSQVGQPTKLIGLEGSIICIEPGKDLGLLDNEAEGITGNYNFQVILDVFNQNQYEDFPVDLQVICVFDGTLVISNTQAMASIGVANREEVLNAPVDPKLSWNALEKVYGGDFFSKFKNLASNVNSFLKKYKPISRAASAIPHPTAQRVGQIADVLGYGVMAGEMDGGVLYGGKKMSKAELRKKLNM